MKYSLYKIPGEVKSIPRKIKQFGMKDPSAFFPYMFPLKLGVILPGVNYKTFKNRFVEVAGCFPDLHIADSISKVAGNNGVWCIKSWGVPCWILVEVSS